ncbi:MAG TPA: hypothetical protein VFD36_30520 [Kofleriaceae bacterium]|nr:hypothetical protein [Kofleriaceae bacterium]
MTAEPGGMFGYWRESPPGQFLGYPDPGALVDPAWEPARRERIVEYLRAGKALAAYPGYASCRFADCTHAQRDHIGSQDLTDGHWIWPEGLWHYVQDHAVRLPDEFVATAVAGDFAIAADLGDRVVAMDPAFWLRWSAEHTSPPPAAPDACSLDEAQAIMTDLSTQRWTATVAAVHGRWELELTSVRATERTTQVDYSAPISAYALRDYLFERRLPDSDKQLEPDRAAAIAREYASGKRRVKFFARKTLDDGHTWWAMISSGPAPTRPLEDIDLRAVPLPDPGWATFLPGNWKVEVKRAMDEPAWRFFLERWRREIASGSSDEPPEPPEPPEPAPAPTAPPSGWRRLLRSIVGR